MHAYCIILLQSLSSAFHNIDYVFTAHVIIWNEQEIELYPK